MHETRASPRACVRNSYSLWESQVYVQLRSGEAIHDTLAASVLAAPLAFFEATPGGRLLQRFAKDMDVIDNNLVTVSLLFEHGQMQRPAPYKVYMQ